MKSKTNVSVRNNIGQRVTSDMILGQNGTYPSATILDANATQELVNQQDENVENLRGDVDALQQDVQNIQSLIYADESTINTAIDKFEEIVEFLDGIEPGSELCNIIMAHIDSGSTKVIKHIEVMTMDQYNALSIKNPNTEYNIIES